MDQSSTKRCNKCGEDKPLSAFGKHKSGRLGRRSVCKACKHDEYVVNKEVISRQQRAYYRRNRDSIIARNSAYQAERREERREYLARYYKENKERLSEYNRQYRAANSERRVHAARQRKAKIRGADGTHTLADIRTKYDEQEGCCYWCSDDLNSTYHVDHIVPISKDGGNGPGNICCSCVSCNLAKADKMPWEFSDRLF